MIEIKYKSSSTQGFSIDDITKEHLQEEKMFCFIGNNGRKIPFYISYHKYDNPKLGEKGKLTCIKLEYTNKNLYSYTKFSTPSSIKFSHTLEEMKEMLKSDFTGLYKK